MHVWAAIDFKGQSICLIYPEKRHRRYTKRSEELTKTKLKNRDKIQKLRACLVSIFENCFMFSKIRRTRKKRKARLVPCLLLFRKIQRTQKILNQNNKNSFQRTPKWCFLCFHKPFSITVFKNRNQTGPKC